MKNIVCWRKEIFLVGIIVFLMLMMSSCSNNTTNNSETGNDTHRTEQTGITSAITGIINALNGDNQSDTNQAPTITSADSAEFTVGSARTFTVTATGTPKPTFALTGDTLPSGITFNNSTGVLSGTPANGTNGIYNLTITASNGVSPDATQNFTLAIVLPPYPIITSANKVKFSEGRANTFTFSATGTPAPTFSLTGTLPSGVTFDASTHKLSGKPAAGTTGDYPLIITASNGVSPNAIQNFTLTVIVGLPAFNTSCLPLLTTGYSYGSFAFDAEGNLLFEVASLGEIRSLDRETCTVTTVAPEVLTGGYDLLGMTYDQDSIYVGVSNGSIYKVNSTTGVSTLLTTISGEYINGLVIAPSTYGAYGGQLIVATYNGRIYAVNQAVASPTPVQIAYIGTDVSALVFDSDGTLYLADYMNNKIVTLTAGGTVADFATSGLNGPDGLAFGNNVLYVVNSEEDTLKSVTIPGGIVSTITSIDFSGGWFPSPIIYDSDSNILLMGYGGSLTIGNYNF